TGQCDDPGPCGQIRAADARDNPRSFEVDRHDLVPLVRVNVFKGAAVDRRVDGRVVDDRVHGGLQRGRKVVDLPGELVGRGGIGDVRGESPGATAGFGHGLHGFVDAVGVNVDGGDRVAAAGKTQREGSAQPAGGTGDDHGAQTGGAVCGLRC